MIDGGIRLNRGSHSWSEAASAIWLREALWGARTAMQDARLVQLHDADMISFQYTRFKLPHQLPTVLTVVSFVDGFVMSKLANSGAGPAEPA